MNLKEKLNKVKQILDDSDIVWTKYGSETKEDLAKKIVINLESDDYLERDRLWDELTF